MSEGLRWKITKAVRGSDLSATAKVIMFVLADIADVGTAEIPPQFSPSLKVLAQETSLARNTVTRYLDALEKAGWLKRTQPSKYAQGLQERTSYALRLPKGTPEPELPRSPSAHTQVPESATQVPESAYPGPQEDSPRSSGDLVTNKEVRSSSDPSQTTRESWHICTYVCQDRNYRCLQKDPHFAAFWAAYPRKEAVAAARAEWALALQVGANPSRITTGATAYANKPGREAKFTAQPANWLHEERWLDQPTEVASPRRPAVEGW